MRIMLEILVLLFGMVLGISFSYKTFKTRIKRVSNMSDKHLEMFLLMNRWLQNEHKGKKIADYLKEKGIHNVMIYGVGGIGKNLYEQLKREEFEIKYLVDQNKNQTLDGRGIKGLNDKMDPADAVVVTAIYYFEELEEELKIRFGCPVISLADIIYKM